MPHFELRVYNNDSRSVELWVCVIPAGKRTPVWEFVHSYAVNEQYPLGTDRFINNKRNLFIDILSLIEEQATAQDVELLSHTDATRSEGKTSEYTTVSVRSLAQRAARAAADGSGNARRFKDARHLWEKISRHAYTTVTGALTEPITDVRKSHNWKKNQPFKDRSAHPDAWFVTRVYSRSNPRKEPFVAIRSLEALWTYMRDTTSDGKILSLVQQMENAVTMNCDYPTYGELASLLGDSNMLVFPTDSSFIEWMRQVAGNTDEISRDTLVEAYIVPNPALDEDDPSYMPAVSTGSVLHLANVLERKDA
ncbi:hypothetical protein EJ419_05155 [Alloscardovia theropitheci]|uniref:Uncharacterized protein n=1 Tax=Alloscardovia theropitheci TaxID=2496842 RepID=A0A4V2MTW3_9BIFI|nr:hypothetical protein [Alloscardovia theropitheci]TCD54049.1 hypothetical protein EJ419_05155 [Alloscardovia theropitheci]